MAAKKPTAKPVADIPSGITFSPATLKWTAGFIAACFAVVVGYWQISDRIVASLDARWRKEDVQAAKDQAQTVHDKQVDDQIKGVAKEQAVQNKQVDDQIKGVAKKAEVGRAWVMFNVVNGNATTHATLAKLCKAMKLPGDTCKDVDDEAKGFKQDAATAKATAQAAGKE